MSAVIEIPSDRNPFPSDEVFPAIPTGFRTTNRLPATLLDMLAEQVDNRPNSEAVIELGADRLTYRQLWDRASRVAGGLHRAGRTSGPE